MEYLSKVVGFFFFLFLLFDKITFWYVGNHVVRLIYNIILEF